MNGELTRDSLLIPAFLPRRVLRTGRAKPVFHRVFPMAQKLSDYFRDGEYLALKGTLDQSITGLAIDSRRVVPGTLFFALPGLRADGAMFIDEAMSRGAVAVVVQNMPAHPPGKITFIQVADARAALARRGLRFLQIGPAHSAVIEWQHRRLPRRCTLRRDPRQFFRAGGRHHGDASIAGTLRLGRVERHALVALDAVLGVIRQVDGGRSRRGRRGRG